MYYSFIKFGTRDVEYALFVAPILVFALNDSDPFTSYMATYNASIDEWLQKTPNNTIYLFFSFEIVFSQRLLLTLIPRYLAEDVAAAARMTWLRALYTSRMAALDFSAERTQQLLNRMFFANVSATTNTASFMQGVLNQWVSPSNVISASSSSGMYISISQPREGNFKMDCICVT